MALFDQGDLVARLVELVKSPRVQYIGNQLNRTAQDTVGRPLKFNSGFGSSSTGPVGAMPKLGGALNSFRQAAIGAAPKQQGMQQSDPLMELYMNLIDQLQSPVAMPTGIDTKNLMSQVENAINPIYDQRIQQAQGEYERGKSDIQGMYGALSKQYEELAPQQIQQAQMAQQEIENLYGQLRSNITGDFARISEEQGDLFKMLGIEDALPEVIAEQQAPVQDALTAAAQNQAQQQQRYMDIGQMDATYFREGAPLATMTGNEISTDLLYQLQDYVNQANAERTSGIQSGYLDQLSNAQNQLMQMQQLAQQEEARRQGMLFEMLQSQMQSRNQPQDLNVDTFMSSLPPQIQQSVAGAFTQLQRSPEAIYGKTKDPRNPVPESFVETTPEWYMAQADAMLQNGQIDPTTHQALLMYMQLYFGLGGR